MDLGDQIKKDINDRIHDRMQRRMRRFDDRMQRRHYRSGVGGMLIGGLIVIIGLLILLDNMGIVRLHDIWRYWPVLLIMLGVSKVVESRSPSGYVWGGVITSDGAEAEIATPPIRARPGFTDQVRDWAQTGEAELRNALPPGIELDGYSAHISAAMPARLNDRVCRL